jgi:hypothetical protein
MGRSYNVSVHILTFIVCMLQLHCCGVHNLTDWKSVFGNDSLPDSCCDGVPMDNLIGKCKKEEAYQVGCAPLLIDSLKSKATIIGTVAILVAFIQVSIQNRLTMFTVDVDFFHIADHRRNLQLLSGRNRPQ